MTLVPLLAETKTTTPPAQIRGGEGISLAEIFLILLLIIVAILLLIGFFTRY